MLKTLGAQIKEFKTASLLTPLCMIGEVLMETIVPYLMSFIIDKGIYGGSIENIFKYGGLMLVAAVLGLLAGFGGGFFGAKASTGFGRNLRKAMYANIQNFSFANIDKFSTAGLVTRMTTDVTNLQNAYQMILRMCIRAPFSLICAMIMSFIICPKLARIYLIAVVILGALLLFIMSRTFKYFDQVFKKYDDLNSSVQENVSAIRVVKAFVREKDETTKFTTASGNVYNMFVKAEKLLSYNSPLMMGTVYACILLISWFGAHYIVYDGLSTGSLTSMLSYCMNIMMSLMMLSMVFVMISMASASGKRVAEVLEEKPTIVNPENPVMEVKDGSILFEHVDFSYRAGSGEPVLKDINLDIRSGETIGIIGSTGSAKSSLVNLISRLYDVTKGDLKVGGIDVRNYDLEVLRNSVSVVLQKNVLFSGSILDNLRWGNPNATEEECREACILACADEFIQNFPEGYNTHIEQGGSNVSGGQRQRLCIARALLKKPKVLILDDSTSAVDTATDAQIRAAFAEKIPGTTKLIISQRVSSVHNADRIIVMENGQINGFDTPENLLETNKIYREVYDSQTSGSGDFDEPNGL